jgi:hypothetical protein
MSEEEILGTARKDLVPAAERPYAPVDHQETVAETIWHNPTEKDVVLDLYVGIPNNLRGLVRSGKRLTWEQRTGKRRYIIKAKSRRAIPSEFDMAIQHMQCQDPSGECSQKPFECKNRAHRRTIIGGLAPHTLVMEGLQHRPTVSDALDDKYAAAQAHREKVAEALIAKSDNEVALKDATEELRRLREEIARKELQLGSVSEPVKEAALSSERSGVAATSSQIHALEEDARRLPSRKATKE